MFSRVFSRKRGKAVVALAGPKSYITRLRGHLMRLLIQLASRNCLARPLYRDLKGAGIFF